MAPREWSDLENPRRGHRWPLDGMMQTRAHANLHAGAHSCGSDIDHHGRLEFGRWLQIAGRDGDRSRRSVHDGMKVEAEHPNSLNGASRLPNGVFTLEDQTAAQDWIMHSECRFCHGRRRNRSSTADV